MNERTANSNTTEHHLCDIEFDKLNSTIVEQQDEMERLRAKVAEGKWWADEAERLRRGIEKALREAGSSPDRYATNARIILEAVLRG